MDYSILTWLLKTFLVFILLLLAFGALGISLIMTNIKPVMGEYILKVVVASLVIIILIALVYIALLSVAFFGGLL